VDDLRSPAGWLPVHRDQLRAQRSVSSMGSLYLYLFRRKLYRWMYKRFYVSFRPSRYCVLRCGLLLQTEQRGLSVCRLVCLFVTIVSPAKMAEPIETPFWVVDSGCPREPCVRWGTDLPAKGQFWGVSGGPLQSIGTVCRKLCKNDWIDTDAVWNVDSGRPKEACTCIKLECTLA